MKAVFLTSIVDNIGAKFGLEDVVSVEDLGTEIAESWPGDTLSRGSQVHNQ